MRSKFLIWLKSRLNKISKPKSITMFNAAAEMDKLEDNLPSEKPDHKKVSLNEILLIARPILVVASNLFFLPRKAREILKSLIAAIDMIEQPGE